MSETKQIDDLVEETRRLAEGNPKLALINAWTTLQAICLFVDADRSHDGRSISDRSRRSRGCEEEKSSASYSRARNGQRREELAVEALIEAADDHNEATLLLARAGFPKSRMPNFTNPFVFWTKVVVSTRKGVVEGGLPRILEEAAAWYPDNPAFADYRRSKLSEGSSREDGQSDADGLVKRLSKQGVVPIYVQASMGTVQIYGSLAVRPPADFIKSSGEYKVSRSFASAGLSALDDVLEWFYVHYLRTSCPNKIGRGAKSPTKLKEPPDTSPARDQEFHLDTCPCRALVGHDVAYLISRAGQVVALHDDQGPRVVTTLEGRLADGVVDDAGRLWVSLYGSRITRIDGSTVDSVSMPEPVLTLVKAPDGVLAANTNGTIRHVDTGARQPAFIELDEPILDLHVSRNWLAAVGASGAIYVTEWPVSGTPVLRMLDTKLVGRIAGTFAITNDGQLGVFGAESVAIVDTVTGGLARKATSIPGGILRAEGLENGSCVVLSSDGALWLLNGEQRRVVLVPDDEVSGFVVVSGCQVVAWTVEGGLHVIGPAGQSNVVLRQDVVLAFPDPWRAGSVCAVVWDTTKKCRVRRRAWM